MNFIQEQKYADGLLPIDYKELDEVCNTTLKLNWDKLPKLVNENGLINLTLSLHMLKMLVTQQMV